MKCIKLTLIGAKNKLSRKTVKCFKTSESITKSYILLKILRLK